MQACAPTGRAVAPRTRGANGPRQASRRTLRRRAAKSEYGLEMPTDRVEPIISTNTPEQNKSEARAWIAKWRARSAAPSKPAPAAAAAAPAPAAAKPAPAAASAPAPSSPANEPVSPEVAKGQRTAIWTGAVSIALGLAYFALTIMLDMRGSEMLPPPPEAYGP